MIRTCLGLSVVGFALLVMDAPVARSAPARKPAVAPTSYFVKTAASLAEVEKTLQGKGGHGARYLLKPGATAVEIVWRHEEDFEQTELELHDGKDHIFFVTEGQATLTLGGELVAPREVSAGEWKAAKATNARTVDVGKGHFVLIPHGTVHGRSAKGRRFTMLIVSFFPRGARRLPRRRRRRRSDDRRSGMGPARTWLCPPCDRSPTASPCSSRSRFSSGVITSRSASRRASSRARARVR